MGGLKNGAIRRKENNRDSGYRLQGPFARWCFSDLGAEVIRVDRVSAVPNEFPSTLCVDLLNGRKSVAFDLKNQEGIKALLRLVEEADALIEGFRQGV